MAKLFNGSINFPSTMTPTGAQPLDDRSVVKTLVDLLSADTFGTALYNGMMVSVVDEKKVYMLVDKKKSTSEEGWVAVGADNGSVAVDDYSKAVAMATNENLGQVIYVKNESEYDSDGEGEASAVTYDAGAYIVVGEGSLMKLATSSATGDIVSDVAGLLTDVSELKETVGDTESGLVKDVDDLQAIVGDDNSGLVKELNDLKQEVSEIEVPVTDVKVTELDANGSGSTVSVLVDGIATVDLTSYAKVSTVKGSAVYVPGQVGCAD